MDNIDEICKVYIAVHMENALRLRGFCDEQQLLKSALDFAAMYLKMKKDRGWKDVQ